MIEFQKDIIPAVESEYLNSYPQFGTNYVQVSDYFEKQGANLLQLIIIGPKKQIIRKIKNSHPKLGLIVGGNIKSIDDAKEIFNSGADYVVIGRLFILNPELISVFIKKFGKKLIISVDDNDGYITPNKNVRSIDYVKNLISSNVQNINYVNDKTKLMGRININMFKKLRNIAKNCNLIYSGGVESLKDIAILKNEGADSIIVGTALYKNKLDLIKAVNIYRS